MSAPSLNRRRLPRIAGSGGSLAGAGPVGDARPMTTDPVKGYELTSTLGSMFENTIALARIVAGGLLDRHLLNLVCPHRGGASPYICGRMDHQLRVLRRGPQNLQRKPSDSLRSIYRDVVSVLPEAMCFAVAFSSPGRLPFASDHPWVEPKEILEPPRSLRLPAAAEAAILAANARRLFQRQGRALPWLKRPQTR